jgi:hypothetical protein
VGDAFFAPHEAYSEEEEEADACAGEGEGEDEEEYVDEQ